MGKAMEWKRAARLCLHSMGGLAMVRHVRRRQFRILMFHSFRASDEANLKAICSHIARHFEPVSLSDIVNASASRRPLPDAAVTVTVDDGYRNYLEYGHTFFRSERIPVTMYTVAGFAEGRMWLWTDQVEFCLEHTAKTSMRAEIEGRAPMELDLSSTARRAESVETLWEALKLVPNRTRLEFLEGLPRLCGVEKPESPPEHRAAMTWDELRMAASEGVEVGCHTSTHPILSRIEARELEGEVRGAKELMEQRLGFHVDHFCYPNGREMDISAEAVEQVRRAGFRSAVTTVPGLNSVDSDLMLLRRIPCSGDSREMPLHHAFERLAGLHQAPGKVSVAA